MAEPASKPSGPFQQPINPDAQRLAAQPPKQPVRIEGTRATPATNLYDGSPQDRWQADQDARTKNDPWLDPNKVLTRDAAGNIVAHEKKIGADGEPTIGNALDQPDGDAAKPVAEPADGVDADKLIKIGDTELTQKQWLDAITSKAQADFRAALVPPTPAEYRLEFPKDLKMPVGVVFEFASLKDPVKGPLIQGAQEWAHRNNLSQGQFSELLGLYATSQAHENITTHERAKAEATSLGVTAPARIDAISMFLRGHYGDTAAKPMLMTLSTRHQVEIWEDVIRKLTNGGGGSFSQRGRELDDGTVDDKTYNSWNYSQRKEYAERMSARAASGGRQ